MTERQIALPPAEMIGVAMSQTQQTDQTRRTDEIIHPLCARCHAPMWLTRVEDEYPGYKRRTFECQACSTTMTEWTCTAHEGRV
jgi:hypothetical protein